MNKKRFCFIVIFIIISFLIPITVLKSYAAVDEDACYTGTKHTHQGNSSTYGGCYTGAATEVRGSCNGYCSSSRQYGCEACGSWYAGGSTCAQCGSTDTNSWLNYYCSTCGYSGLDPGHRSTVIGYNYALSCGKTEGVYYNADGSVSQNISNLVVTSLVPSASSQTLTAGQTVNAKATATFLDGHTETVTCTVTGFNATLYNQAQSVTLSYGTYADTAKNKTAKTTTITVTVNGYFNLTVATEDGNKGTVSGGGSKLAGSTVSISATAKTGYSFGGWYNGSTKVSGSANYSFTMPANAYSLTAKFTTNTYALTVTSESTTKGTVSGTSGNVSYGASCSVTATAKTGYTFEGWYNGNTKVGSNKTYSFIMPANAYALTAKFTGNQYTLTVNANSGTLESSTTTYPLTFGTGNYSDISWLKPAKTGYTFKGWYTAASGGTQVYNASGTVVNDGTYWSGTLYAYAGNLTLYAQWSANTYTVAFNANGGTVTPTSKTVTYDSTYGTLPTPTRIGYTFTNWTYNGSALVASSVVSTAQNHTLTANWMARMDIKYTVNHHVERNGEYRLYETKEYKGTADAVISLSGHQTIYKEFEYKEGKVSGVTKETVSIAPDGSLVLDLYYARKNPIVTFYYLYTDGFLVSMKPYVVASVENASGSFEITENIPDNDTYSREGNKLCMYRFVCWEDENGNIVSSLSDIVEDMTLYAKYELVPYLNPDSDTADAGSEVQGLRKTETATEDEDNTFRFLEYGNTKLDVTLTSQAEFDYVTTYYSWLGEERTIQYADGTVDAAGVWHYVDPVYEENEAILYDNKKYLIEIIYYAKLPEEEVVLVTHGANIIFVPYDVWKHEIIVGREII